MEYKGGFFMSKILTAYFSRAGENYFGGEMRYVEVGNTEIAAGLISECVQTDTFKIEMVHPYSDDYKTCVHEAAQDLKSGARPQITDPPHSPDAYDTVILAYPNYCGTMPAAVFTFLEKYDFSGKKILPLCTNEGSGMGVSVADIKKLCPNSEVADGLPLNGSRVSSSKPQIEKWLKNENLL